MAKLFKWDDKYSVKVPSLDAQHQGFFEVTNEILKLLDKPRNPELKSALVLLLVELGNYVSQHLNYEESLISQNHCLGCVGHPEAHAVFKAKINGYLKQISEENIDTYALAKETAEFTQFWLSNHILGKDRCYIDCLSQKNIK